jgi:hypothetical protein
MIETYQSIFKDYSSVFYRLSGCGDGRPFFLGVLAGRDQA